MITDPVFYRLFETSPETFFLLLGMSADLARDTAARYEYRALEFKETSHRVDGVFLPKEAGLPCLLSDEARKLFIHHFEQKMNSPMTHPHTGFKVDYRRCINLQVMELARCIRGEVDRYPPGDGDAVSE